MDEAFKLMLEPRRHRCLGARLEPLTVGHIFLLRRLESPFISQQPITAVRLFEAVFVCCQSHQKAEVNMQRWWAGLVLWCWGRLHRKTDMNAEAEKFEVYLTENFSVARIKPQKNRSTTEAGAPWELRILIALMFQFHWSEETALDCPLVKANALLAAHAEARGDLELWTDRERDFWEFARQQDQLLVNRNGTS